jgi:hypothetical protein
LSGDRVLVAEDHVLWTHALVGASLGGYAWKRRTPWLVALALDDVVVATTRGDPGLLRVADTMTGNELWSARIGQGASVIGVVGELLWAHDTDESLVGLELQSGRAVHRLAIARPAMPVLLDPDGCGHILSPSVRYQIVDLARGQSVRTMHFEKLDPIVFGAHPHLLGSDRTLLFTDDRTRLFRIDPARPDPRTIYHRLEPLWETGPSIVDAGAYRDHLFLLAQDAEDASFMLHCFGG